MDRLPPELLEAAGICSEEAQIFLKTDLTDDFLFGEVWLLIKDHTLYKLQQNPHSVETFNLMEDDELVVEIAATTLAVALKRGDDIHCFEGKIYRNICPLKNRRIAVPIAEDRIGTIRTSVHIV